MKIATQDGENVQEGKKRPSHGRIKAHIKSIARDKVEALSLNFFERVLTYGIRS